MSSSLTSSSSGGSDSGSSSNGSSASLLLGLQQRQDTAWQQLVDLYAPLVRGWCHTAGVGGSEALDVVQEVFLAVHRNVHGFVPRAGTGGFRGWLWTIARNQIRSHFRRVQDRERAAGGSTAMRWIQSAADPLIDPQNEALDEVPETPSEMTALMHRALDYVRVEFRAPTWEAFWNTTVLGRSTDEVADQLGVTPAAVRQSRSRVLRRLRQQLGDL